MLVPAPDIDDRRRAVTTDRMDGSFPVTLMWEVQGNGMRPAPVKKSQPTHPVGWASLPQESQRNLDVFEGNRVDQTGRLASRFGIVSMDQDQRDTSLWLDDI